MLQDLFHAGDDADSLYVVITGRAKLRHPNTREIVAEVSDVVCTLSSLEK